MQKNHVKRNNLPDSFDGKRGYSMRPLLSTLPTGADKVTTHHKKELHPHVEPCDYGMEIPMCLETWRHNTYVQHND